MTSKKKTYVAPEISIVRDYAACQEVTDSVSLLDCRDHGDDFVKQKLF